MKYFSGFCFQNEELRFQKILQNTTQYSLAGFSLGAIMAFETALKSLPLAEMNLKLKSLDFQNCENLDEILQIYSASDKSPLSPLTRLNSRIDKLILISPSFFQNLDSNAKNFQLKLFNRNQTRYLQNFYNLCSDEVEKCYKAPSSRAELEFLLNYVWDLQKLVSLALYGVEIQIHIGLKDAIINPIEALKFFLPSCINSSNITIYIYKDGTHFLAF